MRVTTLLCSLLYASVATSSSLNPFGGSQKPLDDDKVSVPGKNPLVYCSDPSDYLLDLEYVDISPNPPIPGQPLSIKANGTLSKDIEAGAHAFVQVKFGMLTLIKQKADLCDQLSNLNMTCPIEKGPMNITREADIPEQVPKGKYSVIANVTTVDDEIVTCMESVVIFS